MRDKLNEQETKLLGAILNIAFDTGVEEGQQVVDTMLEGAVHGLSDIEKEHNTWSTLESIHNGDIMAVVDAIIEGNWIKDGVIHIPYWGKYFRCGYAGRKTEIDMNSDFQVTVDYVSRIKQRKRILRIEYHKKKAQERLERLKNRKR